MNENDDVTVIVVTGELDRGNVPDVMREVRAAATRPSSAVVLDLTAVTFIDLGAFRALHALDTMWRDRHDPPLTIFASDAIRRARGRIRPTTALERTRRRARSGSLARP